MGTRGEQSLRWLPRGVCDTLLGDDSPPGAMTSLQDLIFDPSTPGALICRPANTQELNFSSLPGSPGTAGVCTVAYQVGNVVYGLVSITAGTYSGYDYPFAWNHTTMAFVAISGITTANVPVSQATSGAWTPPQMTLTGVKLVTTHIGFPGATKKFGVFDITTPATPAWSATDTATNSLPNVPQGCQTFNNRTYFFNGNVLYYTDTLALTMTNANQSITVGDNTNIICAAPLPSSSSTLNIQQGILLYKLNSLYLVTGDAAGTGTNGIPVLANNQLSSSVGTAAPRSVVSTPEGVKFMSPDGIRTVNFFGQVSTRDPDLALPFIYSVTPSRVAACYGAGVYRICTQNGIKTTTPFEDYWYNFRLKAWTGPHSFRYDTIVAISNDFILSSNAIVGKMWYSYSVQGHQGTGVTFVENGAQMTFNYQTPPMLDLDNMFANLVLRSTLEIAVPASGQTYNFTMQNESGTQLASASITESTNQAIWGSFNWGAKNWGASTSGLFPVQIPWDNQCISNRFVFQASGNSSLGFKIAGLRNGYKRLNYLLN